MNRLKQLRHLERAIKADEGAAAADSGAAAAASGVAEEKSVGEEAEESYWTLGQARDLEDVPRDRTSIHTFSIHTLYSRPGAGA